MNKGTSLKTLFAIFILTFLLNSNFAFAKYSGGDGTESNPWKISNKADLIALGNNTGDYSAYFVMTNDINMAGDIYTNAIIAKDTDNSKDYFQGTPFNGTFDGNDFKIIGLTIDDGGAGNYCLGLFGYVLYGQIMNLGIIDSHISGNGAIGSLAGSGEGCSISNCYSYADVSGSALVD